MKICLASLAPFVGGAEKAMERLALGLSDKGHKVVCALGARGEVADRLTRAGVSWHSLSMPHTDILKYPQYWLARRGFQKFLAIEKVDILHSNDLPSFQLAGDAAGRLGIPKICHHRYLFDGKAIEWFTKTGADAHVFVSQGLQTDLLKTCPGLNSQLCCVNHDGLMLPALPSSDDIVVLKQSLDLPLEKTIVLFAGQIIPRKGVQDLIKAWQRLPADTTCQAHLVIIGEDLAGNGNYRRQMEQLARETCVNADFKGFQTNVDQWLDVADIVTVPSHIEPLGNATLEAMAHAKPVIGTCVGGIPEMIRDGSTGLLIPPKNAKALSRALWELIVDPLSGKKMGINARKRCEQKFSLEAHAGRAEELYLELLKKN